MASSKPNIAPPAYTAQDRAHPEAFLSGLLERGAESSRSANPKDEALEQEVARLKNFTIFVLSIDDQRNTDCILTSVDRDHFTTMHNTLRDLIAAHNEARPSNAERTLLAPYFWKYLHEPCRVLRLPVDYVLTIIARFLKYMSYHGWYKGCCYGLLHCHGTKVLAEKLYMDQMIIIPAVFDDPQLRLNTLTGLANVRMKYFDVIDGIGSATMVPTNGFSWNQEANISYVANERGRSYDTNRRCTINTPHHLLSINHWTKRVKDCTSTILARHRDAKAGKRAPDPFPTWRGGPSDLLLAGTPNTSHLYPWPIGWSCWASVHLPDFFENRPHPRANGL